MKKILSANYVVLSIFCPKTHRNTSISQTSNLWMITFATFFTQPIVVWRTANIYYGGAPWYQNGDCKWPVAKLAPDHYLNQWWLVYWRIHTRPQSIRQRSNNRGFLSYCRTSLPIAITPYISAYIAGSTRAAYCYHRYIVSQTGASFVTL